MARRIYFLLLKAAMVSLCLYPHLQAWAEGYQINAQSGVLSGYSNALIERVPGAQKTKLAQGKNSPAWGQGYQINAESGVLSGSSDALIEQAPVVQAKTVAAKPVAVQKEAALQKEASPLPSPAPPEAFPSTQHKTQSVQPSSGWAAQDYVSEDDAPSSVIEAGPLIVHVTLNGSDAGDYFMTAMPDGDITAERGALKEIGLVAPFPGDDGSGEQVSLSAMAPKLTYKLNTQAGLLEVLADPLLMPVHREQLAREQPDAAEMLQSNALFLNYDVNYNQSRGSRAVYTAPLELGANWHAFSWINRFNWQQRQPIRRSSSQLVYDDQANLRRWMLGDIQGSAGASIGGASLGGIRMFKNYGLDPSLFTGPPLAVKAMLKTTSEVEVRIDGQPVYKGTFPAGQLDLNNVPYFRSGLGQVEIVVRDAFGRETIFNQEFYTVSSLLAPGLHAYDYSLGVDKTTDARGRLRYAAKPMLFASHRYGLTDWFTPGLGLESNGRDMRGGLLADVVLGQFGHLNLTAAGSSRQGLRGGHISADYSFIGSEALAPSLFFNMQTQHYGGILDAPTQALSAVHWQGGAALSTRIGGLASLTGRWSHSKRFNRIMGQDASLILSTTLPGQISLSTQLTRSWQQKTAPSNQINASLGHSFSNGLYLSANFSRSNRSNSFGIQIQLSPPLGDGFGYNASVNAPDQGDASMATNIQYHHRYAELQFGRSGTKQAPSYNASLRGSLLLANSSLHAGRPIRDSFALVKVGEMEHVKVSVQNQYIGETNAHGELMLPYINAYSSNTINIDASVIPLGYSIDSNSKRVTSHFRGGGLTIFKVAKMHVVGGKFYYRRHGKNKAAQYSGLEYELDGEKTTSIVGVDGEFYLENIPAGSYAVRLFDAHHDCRFDLVIPESDDIINDLGDVICEIDKQSKEKK